MVVGTVYSITAAVTVSLVQLQVYVLTTEVERTLLYNCSGAKRQTQRASIDDTMIKYTVLSTYLLTGVM